MAKSGCGSSARTTRRRPIPNDAYDFGLQDTKGNVVSGVRDAQGRFFFDFGLTVKTSKQPDRPLFGGPFANGPADDRFV